MFAVLCCLFISHLIWFLSSGLRHSGFIQRCCDPISQQQTREHTAGEIVQQWLHCVCVPVSDMWERTEKGERGMEGPGKSTGEMEMGGWGWQGLEEIEQGRDEEWCSNNPCVQLHNVWTLNYYVSSRLQFFSCLTLLVSFSFLFLSPFSLVLSRALLLSLLFQFNFLLFFFICFCSFLLSHVLSCLILSCVLS